MILVTGASGFIGKALKEKLTSMGLQYCTLDSGNGGVVNRAELQKYAGKNISCVFHLAAKTFVPDSWIDIAEFMDVNLVGTQNVLELCYREKAKLVFVSAYVYGAPDILPVGEDAKVSPNNPYAQSKYLVEQLCTFYAKHLGLNLVIARPFNIFGPGQNKRFLIPHIVDRLLNSESVVLKHRNTKRDFLYIEDFIDSLIKMMNYRGRVPVFNIGSGKSIAAQEVVDIAQSILHCNKPVIFENTERKNEIMEVVANVESANKELGWSPRYSMRDGVAMVIKRMQEDIVKGTTV